MIPPISGLIIKAQSGFFTVHTAQGDFVCQLPGRLKKEKRPTNLAAVGDRVTITPLPNGKGMIESVSERVTVLSRARPTPSPNRASLSDREQILLANPDQVVLVFSIRQPEPTLRKLDRFLVVTERNQIPTVICITKMDLVQPAEATTLFQPYVDLNYPVLYTSAKTGLGLEQLHAFLANKISVLAGSSGVGKSSLLNALQPGLGLKVAEVSQATEKGMHTTRYVELIPFAGGYVADTPGVRGLGLYDIEPNELDAYFREMMPLVTECQFSNCTHVHEPDCAVRAAVSAGTIHPARYESYLRLRQEQELLDQASYGLS